jgi:hypothetical protein
VSRSGYSDDGDYLNLWRANVERSLAGKRGQEFLRELIAALEEMPNKRLITDALQGENGEVCAIGAVGLKRGIDMKGLDPEEYEAVAATFKIPTILAQEIVYENDEHGWRQTPEERWARMHKWASDNLKTA